MKIGQLLAIELYKLLAQRLTYASYAVLAVLVGLVVWGTWRYGLPHELQSALGDQFVVGGKVVTGPLIPLLLLEFPIAVHILIPLLIAVASGGLVAGEKQMGTLRTVLVRPVRRAAVLAAKLLIAWIHATGLVAFMGVVSLVLGYAVFGPGDLILMSFQGRSVGILAEPQALSHLTLAYGLAAVAMMAVASLGVLLSVLCDNPLTAAGLTVAVLLVLQSLRLIPYFEWLQPYLLTEHISAYRQALSATVNWSQVGTSLVYLGAYVVGPSLIALGVFWRQDVRC